MENSDAINPTSETFSKEELHCPLCDYDLRGLTEPRCPECGYQFEWVELMDRTRRTHPFLFEHHPERNVWSFTRTAIAGLRSIRFWKSIKPHMTPRPARLLLYWMICTSMPAALAAALFGLHQLLESWYPSFNGFNRTFPRC